MRRSERVSIGLVTVVLAKLSTGGMGGGAFDLVGIIGWLLDEALPDEAVGTSCTNGFDPIGANGVPAN